MQEFDYIIVGAGCSGMTLVYEMDKAGLLKNKTCAVLDKKKSFERDKIWSYWDFYQHSFKDCLIKEWNEFTVKNKFEEKIVSCKNNKYQSIDSKKFYDKVLEEINLNKNISIFTNTEVERIYEQNGQVIIESSRGKLIAKKVFNSSIIKKETTDPKIYQHFYGCEINSTSNFCYQKNPIIMDFNCDQEDWVHFYYLLPISNNKIFLESTWISNKKNNSIDKYKSEISSYLKKNFNALKQYEVSYSELGSIPLFHFKNNKNYKNIMDIGSAANLTRISTGYTFINIQKFTHSLIDSIIQEKHFDHKKNYKYSFLDNLFMKVLLDKKNEMSEIFYRLFKKNKDLAIIKFLSSESNMLDDIKIILSMPKLVFIRKLFNI
jgi:lycopene beta-cyclase